jgi:small-conductance mechanosensitive channel
MNLLRVSASVAMAIFGLTLLSQWCVAQDAIPGWHTNLDEARKLSESTGKPLFITFRCVR